jgi:hypothetical protein
MPLAQHICGMLIYTQIVSMGLPVILLNVPGRQRSQSIDAIPAARGQRPQSTGLADKKVYRQDFKVKAQAHRSRVWPLGPKKQEEMIRKNRKTKEHSRTVTYLGRWSRILACRRHRCPR